MNYLYGKHKSFIMKAPVQHNFLLQHYDNLHYFPELEHMVSQKSAERIKLSSQNQTEHDSNG